MEKEIKYFGIVCNPCEYKHQASKFIMPDDVKPMNITPETKLEGVRFYGVWMETNYFNGFSEMEKAAVLHVLQLKEVGA